MKVESDLEPKLIEWFKAITDRQRRVSTTRWTFLRAYLSSAFSSRPGLDIMIRFTSQGNFGATRDGAEQAATVPLKMRLAISRRAVSADRCGQEELQESIARAYAQLVTIAPPNYAWQTPPGKIDDWPGKLLGWLLTALATSSSDSRVLVRNIMSESLKLRAAGRKPVDDRKKPDGKEETGRPSFMRRRAQSGMT